MAQIIQVKRTTKEVGAAADYAVLTGNGSDTLEAGELLWGSAANTNTGTGVLYIGQGTNTMIPIGGKAYTDMLDPDTSTDSSTKLVSSDAGGNGAQLILSDGQAGNSQNTLTLKAPATSAADFTLNLPNAQGAVAAGTVLSLNASSKVGGALTATGKVTGDSGLDAGTSGITNAGAISGATTINANNTITGASLTDGSMTINSGSLTGVSNITSNGTIIAADIDVTGEIQGDSIQVGDDGSVVASISDAGAIVGTSLDAGTGAIATTGALTAATLVTTGKVTIGADLEVSGTTTTVNTTDVEVTDSMIQLGKDNDGTNSTPDVGWFGRVGSQGASGTPAQVGIVYDQSAERFVAFENDPDAANAANLETATSLGTGGVTTAKLNAALEGSVKLDTDLTVGVSGSASGSVTTDLSGNFTIPVDILGGVDGNGNYKFLNSNAKLESLNDVESATGASDAGKVLTVKSDGTYEWTSKQSNADGTGSLYGIGSDALQDGSGVTINLEDDNPAADDKVSIVGSGATTVSLSVATDNAEVIQISSTDTTYSSGDFNHNQLAGWDANEHIDWTGASAGTINITNVPNFGGTTAGLVPNSTSASAGTFLAKDGSWTTPSYFTQTTGIADTNTVVVDGTITTGDYVRFTANGLEGRNRTEFLTDLGLDDVTEDTSLVTTNHDYLSISDQAITLGAISLADDVSGTLPKNKVEDSSNWDTAYAHTSNTSNPHSVTKTQVGLGSVENTAVSTWAGTANITTVGTIGTGTWEGTAIADGYVAGTTKWDGAITDIAAATASGGAANAEKLVQWGVSGNLTTSGTVQANKLTVGSGGIISTAGQDITLDSDSENIVLDAGGETITFNEDVLTASGDGITLSNFKLDGGVISD